MKDLVFNPQIRIMVDAVVRETGLTEDEVVQRLSNPQLVGIIAGKINQALTQIIPHVVCESVLNPPSLDSKVPPNASIN